MLFYLHSLRRKQVEATKRDNLINGPRGLKLEPNGGEPLERTIYNTLKKAIQFGYLMPGERLIETSLAEELDVSRTPLRDAIRKLSFEKLVEITPNKGATVTKLSSVDVEEIYFMAGVLQGAAARRAVEYIEDGDIDKLKDYKSRMEEAVQQNDYEGWLVLNNKFHGVFVNKCNMQMLVELIKEKVDRIPYNWVLLAIRPNPLKVYMEAHERIIEAFIKKDANLVRSLVENHISTNGEILKEYLEKIALA